MTTQRILVVDDDPLIRRQLADLYGERSYEVDTASCAEEAMERLAERDYALGVFDLKIPGTDGLSLTKQVRERWPDLDVVIVTGYASIRGAVEAIRQGANDYITKPFEHEEILLATSKILEKRKLLDEIDYLRSQLSDRYSFANMVSRNPPMHEIFSMIESLAPALAKPLTLIYVVRSSADVIFAKRLTEIAARLSNFSLVIHETSLSGRRAFGEHLRQVDKSPRPPRF